MKLNKKALSITCGLFVGLGLFALTWALILLGDNSLDLSWVGKLYLGYDKTPLGSLFGFFWGFVDGAFGGYFFALIYNWLAKE